MLSSFSPELVLKPGSREQYTDLLLRPGTSQLFRLTESEILTAQRLLYIRENVLSFRAQVGSAFLQRNDATDFVRRNFADTLRSTVLRLGQLEAMGCALGGGVNRSVALTYLEKWQNFAPSRQDLES